MFLLPTGQNHQIQRVSPSKLMPLDCWKVILSYICPLIEFKSLSQFSLVCKEFQSLCKESVLRYREYFFYLKIQSFKVKNSVFIDELEIKFPRKEPAVPLALSYLNEKENHLFCSQFYNWNELIIVSPFGSPIFQTITLPEKLVNCFHYDKFLAVVTERGIYLYTFGKDVYKLHKAYKISSDIQGNASSAGIKNGTLFLQMNGKERTSLLFDLKTCKFDVYESELDKDVSTPYATKEYISFGNTLFHIQKDHRETLACKEVQKFSNSFREREASLLNQRNFRDPGIGNESWLIVDDKKSDVQFYDLEKQQLSDEKCGISYGSKIFLRKDFLFSEGKVIHIPTGLNLGTNINKVVDDVLQRGDTLLGMWWFVKKKSPFLRLLICSAPTSLNQKIHVLEIELEKKQLNSAPSFPFNQKKITPATKRLTLDKALTLAGLVLFIGSLIGLAIYGAITRSLLFDTLKPRILAISLLSSTLLLAASGRIVSFVKKGTFSWN